MRKYIPLVSILVILLLAWGIFNFFESIEKRDTLTNVTELYLGFSSHMKDYVDHNLGKINCKPLQYFYTSNNYSQICFVCEAGDVCFEYKMKRGIWESGVYYENIMVPIKSPDIKNTDFGVSFVDFHKHGLASYFNCEKKSDFFSSSASELQCDYGLKFILNESVNINETGPFEIKMVLENEENWVEVSKGICNRVYGENCEQKDLDEKIIVEGNKEMETNYRKMGMEKVCECDGVPIYLKNKEVLYMGVLMCGSG